MSILRSTSSSVGALVMTILSKEELTKRQAHLTDAGRAAQVRVHAAVGSYIIVWANLESLLASVIGVLIRTGSMNAEIIHAALGNSRAKADAILMLAKENADAATLEALKSILVRFKAETKIRNRLAHSTYDKAADGAYTHSNFVNTDGAREGGELVERTPIDRAWFANLNEAHRRMAAIYDDLDAIDRAWRAGQLLKL